MHSGMKSELSSQPPGQAPLWLLVPIKGKVCFIFGAFAVGSHGALGGFCFIAFVGSVTNTSLHLLPPWPHQKPQLGVGQLPQPLTHSPCTLSGIRHAWSPAWLTPPSKVPAAQQSRKDVWPSSLRSQLGKRRKGTHPRCPVSLWRSLDPCLPGRTARQGWPMGKAIGWVERRACRREGETKLSGSSRALVAALWGHSSWWVGGCVFVI